MDVKERMDQLVQDWNHDRVDVADELRELLKDFKAVGGDPTSDEGRALLTANKLYGRAQAWRTAMRTGEGLERAVRDLDRALLEVAALWRTDGHMPQEARLQMLGRA